ncbi:hypothetical protein CLU79DRAFT_734793 [Phycomyces nitens]|nr:hypothetical protein CLU79DRAFT_734793 [Phycomyces nitens]
MSTGLAFHTLTIVCAIIGLASIANALTVTHPFANTNVVAGQNTLVSWSDVNPGTTTVNIYLSKASGTSTTLISNTLATGVNATKGSSTVQISNSIASGTYYIFVRSANDITVGDTIGPLTLTSGSTPVTTALTTQKASSVVLPTKSSTVLSVVPSVASSVRGVSSAAPSSAIASLSSASRASSSSSAASTGHSSATRAFATPSATGASAPSSDGLSSGQIGGIAGGAAGAVILILGAVLLVRRSKRKEEPERNVQRASNLFKDPSGHHGTGGFDEGDNMKDLHHQDQGYTDYRQPHYPSYPETNTYADYGYGADNGGGYYPPSVPIGRFENTGYGRQGSPSPAGVPYSPPMQTMPAPMQEYSSSRYQYTPQLQFQPQWQEQQNYYDYPNDSGMNEMPPAHQGYYYPAYEQSQYQQPPLPQHAAQPMAMPGYPPQQQQYPHDSRSPEPIITQSPNNSQRQSMSDPRASSERAMPEDQRRVMSPTRAAQDSSVVL